MGDCLTETDLHRYNAGDLHESRKARVRRHLAACENRARRDAELVAEQEDIQGRVRSLS